MAPVTSQPPRGVVTKRIVAVAKIVIMVLPIAWIYPRLDWSTVAERAMHFGIVGFFGAGSVLALTVVGLGGAAIVASWLPARRASRIDPMRALREE